MRKIINIAINPCGIGGTETFSRVLNKQFNNSKTYSFNSIKEPIYDAEFTIIRKYRIQRILKNIPLIKFKYIYNLPKAKNDIIILNAPCDLDRIPTKYLQKNKVIYVAHNCPNHILNHKNYLGANKTDRLKKFNFINYIVSLSDDYKIDFSKIFNFPLDKVCTLNHTIEIEPKLHPKKFFPSIITICRLDNKQKRLDLFMRVASSIQDIEFKIYGSGPDEKIISEMSKNLQNVKLCGKTSKLVKAHENAGIFLMTSDFEGSPISLIEALSQGTPVIIAQNSFSRASDIIKNNYNGFVCENFDLNEINEKIEIIKSNYLNFSKNAIKSFENFNQKAFKEQWGNMFNKL